MSERVCLGVITGAHGVRGLVRVKSFTENEEAVASYGTLEDDDGDHVALTLVGRCKGALLARIEGVGDRNTAWALRGTRLFVSRDALPPVDKDQYYHADLIGLRVDQVDGSELGIVVAVHDFGAGDLIDVRLLDSTKSVLLPFARRTVLEVDRDSGRLVVDPMPGMLDDNCDEGDPREPGS